QPFAILADQPLVLELAQDVLQPDAVIALERKRLGDLALARAIGVVFYVAKYFLARGPEVGLCRLRRPSGRLAAGLPPGDAARQPLRPSCGRGTACRCPWLPSRQAARLPHRRSPRPDPCPSARSR